MSRFILILVILASGLSAQVMNTVPSQISTYPVQFGYMIRGKIVDGVDRKEVLHFIELKNDKYWLWETNKYYIKINMQKLFENIPNYFSEPWYNIKIFATLESGTHKIDVPVLVDEEKRKTDMIGRKQFIYFIIDGLSLKKKFRNLISERKYWNLKLTISLRDHEVYSCLKKIEADWSIHE